MLVAAHGNSLRAIVKHLDEISDEAIAKLNIPTGIPLRYDLDADLRPVTAGRRLPRPRGGQGGRRRGRQPGPLTYATAGRDTPAVSRPAVQRAISGWSPARR